MMWSWLLSNTSGLATRDASSGRSSAMVRRDEYLAYHGRDRVDRRGLFVLILERKVQVGSSKVTVSGG